MAANLNDVAAPNANTCAAVEVAHGKQLVRVGVGRGGGDVECRCCAALLFGVARSDDPEVSGPGVKVEVERLWWRANGCPDRVAISP